VKLPVYDRYAEAAARGIMGARRCMQVELTNDELVIINNALNEVCNGIALEGEFETRLGCTVEEARTLLEKISAIASGQ
jgi:hypothetical protein